MGQQQERKLNVDQAVSTIIMKVVGFASISDACFRNRLYQLFLPTVLLQDMFILFIFVQLAKPGDLTGGCISRYSISVLSSLLVISKRTVLLLLNGIALLCRPGYLTGYPNG